MRGGGRWSHVALGGFAFKSSCIQYSHFISIIRQGFGAMTRALMGVSEGSRVVLALEGGYDPRGVADCVVEVVSAMAEGASGRDAEGLMAGMLFYLCRCL